MGADLVGQPGMPNRELCSVAAKCAGMGASTAEDARPLTIALMRRCASREPRTRSPRQTAAHPAERCAPRVFPGASMPVALAGSERNDVTMTRTPAPPSAAPSATWLVATCSARARRIGRCRIHRCCFLQRGERVIAHDRSGRSPSTQPAPAMMDHYADDLVAVTAHVYIWDWRETAVRSLPSMHQGLG
jgi:hypothetical protein